MIYRRGNFGQQPRQRPETGRDGTDRKDAMQARRYFAGLAISTTVFQQFVSFPFRRANGNREFGLCIETRAKFNPFVFFDLAVSVLVGACVPVADNLFDRVLVYQSINKIVQRDLLGRGPRVGRFPVPV